MNLKHLLLLLSIFSFATANKDLRLKCAAVCTGNWLGCMFKHPGDFPGCLAVQFLCTNSCQYYADVPDDQDINVPIYDETNDVSRDKPVAIKDKIVNDTCVDECGSIDASMCLGDKALECEQNLGSCLGKCHLLNNH